MIINVLHRHIKKGKRGCSDGCPVALAIKDATGVTVEVEMYEIRSPKATVESGEELVCLIARYDKGHPMEPFKFEVKDGVAEVVP